MSSRDIFLAACNQLNDGLAGFGFKASQKGACLKKISIHKEFTFEISFQSSTLNSNGYVKLLPHILITSRRLKKWLKAQTDDVYSNDIIYSNQLGYISHFQEWKSWNVSGISQEKAIAEVIDVIKTYAIPIFDLFEDINSTIQFLMNKGTKFNRYTAQSLTPLAFMLCFASKEEAQCFFDNYLIGAPGKRLIMSLYKELKEGKAVDLMHAEFVDAFAIKLAFLQGLKI
ncbi:hypothetical protein HDE69_004560 [Pedobacter cryoconitis]|uniref:DUF4304 domain-containing protein n=1 Tax=Pedobacter cryoconitis TaxID=188932 RepID=A0A7W8YX70_9SPHI|nr:hypothetical protein [Pedobacter cryoconitis]MBB5623474.1 hypothetical protein [Pedobacter cryoconitis]